MQRVVKFSTERSLDRHVQRFHPNQKEEQIMCKTCNSPYSDKYMLKIHDARTHGDETTALSISPTETSEKENTSKDRAEVIGQEEQNDYCEPGLNCIRKDHIKL